MSTPSKTTSTTSETTSTPSKTTSTSETTSTPSKTTSSSETTSTPSKTTSTPSKTTSTPSKTTPSKLIRKELTLEQKIDVIRQHELTGTSSRKLAEKFECGKSQICKILKRKRELEDEWTLNVNSKRQRVGVRPYKDAFEDKLFGWFSGIRAKGIPLSGPMIQAKARELAAEAGIQDFKASNGWLHRFKVYYNIGCKTVSGERGDVDLGEQIEFKIFYIFI